jgi:hypothetical protein
LLDLGNPVFQADWFALERDEALAVLAVLKKLHKVEWEQLYRDRGLHWEAIHSRLQGHTPGSGVQASRGVGTRHAKCVRYALLIKLAT